MGLDMYLTKKYYVKNWKHTKDEDRHEITIKKGGKDSSIPADKIREIIIDVFYWRKANQIHKWFVDNVQGGEDECKESYVERDQLQELLTTVKAVLQDHSQAKILLPTQSGFFFGSTEYDNYYYEDLKATEKGLEEALKEDDGGDFYYHSSW